MKRNPDGTFAQGNEGGPGRPRRQTEAAYLVALSEAVTLDDWREIVKAAVIAAKSGDAQARKWLSDYLLGVNPAGTRPTLARAHALKLAQEAAGDDIEVVDELDDIHIMRQRAAHLREVMARR